MSHMTDIYIYEVIKLTLIMWSLKY